MQMTSDAGPLYFMAFDVVSRILERAGDLDEVSHYVTHTFREMTGARGVCLFATDSLDGQANSRVLSVSPVRNRRFLTPECCLALEELGAFSGDKAVLELSGLCGSDAAGLTEIYSSVLLLPLTISNERFGSVMLFDLPEGGRRTEQILAFLTPVNTLLALVLHHSLRFAHQDKVIEEKTKSLAKSEAFYRLLFDSSPNAMALAETATGILRKVNPSFEALTGRKSSELEGAHQSALHPRSEAPDNEGLKGGFKTHKANPGARTQNLFERPDGVIRSVEVCSRPIEIDGVPCIFGFFNDVTERNEFIEKLKEREELISLLLDSTAEAIYGVDLAGKCTFVNSAFLKTLGFESAEEVLGRNLHKFLHHTDSSGNEIPEEKCKISEVLTDGVPRHETGEIFWRKDGSSFPVEYWAYPIRLEGETIGTVVTFFDVSSRVELEADKTRLQEQLAQAQKMEALGTLAGGIAHDFNNILSVILGYTELGIQKLEDRPGEREDLLSVYHAAERARELVKQILAFSRKASAELHDVDIHLIVSEAVRMLRQTIPTSIDFSISVDKSTGTVLADPTQIHQIVMNLCTNAYHAMRLKGGVLSVDLRRVEVGHLLAARVPNLKEGCYAQLSVGDTGTGIDPITLARIFEPFFTTKAQGEGTGMGLSVVHGIVTQAGGAVDVETALGKGTTFKVYLPLHCGAQKEQALEADSERMIGAGRVMLIDDEPSLVSMTTKMLVKLGYTVSPFTSSVEALTAFAKTPDAWDAVVSDQTMPGFSGAELAGIILAQRPGMPIIICTGYSDVLDEESAKSLGIGALLIKPVGMKKLDEVLRDLINAAT